MTELITVNTDSESLNKVYAEQSDSALRMAFERHIHDKYYEKDVARIMELMDVHENLFIEYVENIINNNMKRVVKIDTKYFNKNTFMSELFIAESIGVSIEYVKLVTINSVNGQVINNHIVDQFKKAGVTVSQTTEDKIVSENYMLFWST